MFCFLIFISHKSFWRKSVMCMFGQWMQNPWEFQSWLAILDNINAFVRSLIFIFQLLTIARPKSIFFIFYLKLDCPSPNPNSKAITFAIYIGSQLPFIPYERHRRVESRLIFSGTSYGILLTGLVKASAKNASSFLRSSAKDSLSVISFLVINHYFISTLKKQAQNKTK